VQGYFEKVAMLLIVGFAVDCDAVIAKYDVKSLCLSTLDLLLGSPEEHPG
jgi:hypothetical protein